MRFEIIRKRPLFFAAIYFCLIILIQSRRPEHLTPSEVSLRIGNPDKPTALSGLIASEVDARDTVYGARLISFELEAKAIAEVQSDKRLPVTGKVKVYLTQPPSLPGSKRRSPPVLAYGDEVLIQGDLRAPKGIRNPGGFDQKAYLDRMGIRALFYGNPHAAPEILKRRQGNYLRQRMIAVKGFLSRSLSDAFDKRDGGFLKALFLGERSDIDEDFKDLFIKTGTMHILSVSGFNIGFLSLTVFFLLKPFRAPKNLKLWLTLAVIWLYCFLVGWQSPVVRASVMATILIIGQLLGRKPNLLNSLGLAALVILGVQPKQLFDVGFQLSFIAVFAIGAVLPIFLEPIKLWPNERMAPKEKARRYVQELFWLSWVCVIVTLPITAQNFYIVTPMALAANMIVVPLSFLIFFTGTIFFLTFWWVPPILFFVPLAIKLMMQCFVGSLFVIENLPGAYFIVGKLTPVLLSGLVAGTIYFLWDKRIKNSHVRAGVLFLFILNIFLTQSLSRELNRKFQMTALDVGQGDAIYFEFPSGGNLLMDAGKGGDGDRGRWVVTPFLKSKGVSTLDALVISHPQEDHIGGMPAVMDEFKVKNVFDAGRPYGSKTFAVLKQKISDENARVFHGCRGQRIDGFRDIVIQVLHPSGEMRPEKNVNNDGLVLKIDYKGNRFLLTGDLEENSMAAMLNSGMDVTADVLKVPHHGAKLRPSGACFVRAVNPKISVISVGIRNAFHHPSKTTLEILSQVPGNRIFRTDLNGAVQIAAEGGGLKVLDSLTAG